MPTLAYVVLALAGYLLGSVPTGFLIARARGVDIRRVGSGNIGATNVLRTLGKPAGILVLVMDALKGVLAAWLAPRLVAAATGGPAPIPELAAVTAGVAAILGHNYTCWLRFKGGKGIATSAGVLLVLMPAALGLALGVWLLVFFISRYVSLSSILAAAALPLAVWLTRGTRLMVGAAIVLATLAIYKHRPNIRRLMDGTESRFGRQKSETNS